MRANINGPAGRRLVLPLREASTPTQGAKRSVDAEDLGSLSRRIALLQKRVAALGSPAPAFDMKSFSNWLADDV